jgi:type II secretory pathway component GspD/PulD (secretin)
LQQHTWILAIYLLPTAIIGGGGLNEGIDQEVQAELKRIVDAAQTTTAAGTAAHPAEAPPPTEEAATNALLEKLASLAGEAEATIEEQDMLLYRCRYIPAASARRMIENFITADGIVAEAGESDLVVVVDAKTNLPRLREILGEVDRYVPQILVEARIVELTVDANFEKEVNLALEDIGGDALVSDAIRSVLRTPGANPNLGEGALLSIASLRNHNDKITAFLRYLETRGRARILSKPNIVLSRGSDGSIVTGEEVPILTQTVTSGAVSTSTEFKSVGIKLRVTPLMITDEMVHVRVSPEVSTVTGYTAAAAGVSNPILAVRQARTELRVKDGELMSIGGLLRNEERRVVRRVPMLSAVPVLGQLFRSEREESVQTQLIILMTIRILAEGVAEGERVMVPSTMHPRVEREIERMESETPMTPGRFIDDVKRLFTR